MSFEMRKAVIRRLNDSRFIREYFVGNGIDIGAGSDSLNSYKEFFPLIGSVFSWDIEHGDAQYLSTVTDNSFDFAVSSHCLEHMVDPVIALRNWLRVIRRKGHLIITVPDEDLYEQRRWPSFFNHDHKHSFTISKEKSWCPKSINVMDLLQSENSTIKIKKIELLDSLFFKEIEPTDQTHLCSESAIEIIIQKL
jgi:SAM-dependent methyltransferase